jgi:V8-like Glu-specific endopeptidase
MAMNLRIVSLLVVCMFWVLNVEAGQGKAKQKDGFIQTIQTVKRATIAVACVKSQLDGTTVIASVEGTGFFISSDGTFITAGHVAHGLYLGAPPRQEVCQKPVIYVPKKGWEAGAAIDMSWFMVGECKFDDDLDLAKCKTVDNPFTSERIEVKPLVVTFDNSIQKEGTEIAFTGFPLSTVQPITARGTIGTYWGLPLELTPREIVIDHSNWPGASGAPVYLSNGKVIGLILRRGINDATGFAFARASKFISDFLSKN